MNPNHAINPDSEERRLRASLLPSTEHHLVHARLRFAPVAALPGITRQVSLAGAVAKTGGPHHWFSPVAAISRLEKTLASFL